MEAVNQSYSLNFSENLSINQLSTLSTTTATAVNVAWNATVARNAGSNAYEWRFILPLYCLIFLLSICGNCMVIATLTSNKRMRTVTNVYLLNLAISDCMLGVFCLPFTLVGQIYRRFLFGATMCKLVPFLQALSVSVDVWTLVAISLERYFAICRPLKSRKWQTQCHAYKMIAMVWLLSVTLNSPILLVSTLQPMRRNTYKCREVWPNLELERAFNLGLDVALLLIPVFVMSFSYSLIVTKLWRGMQHEIQHNFNFQRQLSGKYDGKENLLKTTPIVRGHSTKLCCKDKWPVTKKGGDSNLSEDGSTTFVKTQNLELDFRHVVRSTNTDKSIMAKRKVIRMLFVIILEFFICWTPLHVINTIYLFYPEELYKYVGSKGIVSLQLLAYCSSFSNPITYCFMNRRFRQAFICLIKNCKVFGAGWAGGGGMRLAAAHWPILQAETTQRCLRPPLYRDPSRRYVLGQKWLQNIKLRPTSDPKKYRSKHMVRLTSPEHEVIETGEEDSQFLYRITWARSGQAKGIIQSLPRYE